MQLSDYVTIIRRRWWVILLVALSAAAFALLFSSSQTRLFRAEATYALVPSRFDNGLSIVLQNSMNSFRDTALAPVQLERIADEMHIDHDADWMLKYVRIQSLPEDWKMIVQVDYPDDQEMSKKVAQAVGDNMVGLVGSLNAKTDSTDKIYMTVQQPARAIGRVKPTTTINVAAGGILGLILGLLLAFVLESLDNSLKTVADVERFVGLTTLGAIPLLRDERRPTSDKRRPTSVIRQFLRRGT